MTDAEYTSFLKALAGKHLRGIPTTPTISETSIRTELESLSRAARLLKVLERDGSAGIRTPSPGVPSLDISLTNEFLDQLGDRPIHRTGEIMEAVGILPALDDAPSIVFGELRRSAVPQEDIEILKRAGYSEDEIEVFLAICIQNAHRVARETRVPSELVRQADQEFQNAAPMLRDPQTFANEPKKKKKILNGVGKLLGGAIAGVGNALLVGGTTAAPNPATAYLAITSGGAAVSGMFAGLGDLRGE